MLVIMHAYNIHLLQEGSQALLTSGPASAEHWSLAIAAVNPAEYAGSETPDFVIELVHAATEVVAAAVAFLQQNG